MNVGLNGLTEEGEASHSSGYKANSSVKPQKSTGIISTRYCGRRGVRKEVENTDII